MKKTIALALMLSCIVLTTGSLVTSCKSKVKDADIETSIKNDFRSNPAYSGITVVVREGDATLSGEVKDESTKAAAESDAKKVKGVQGVTNNLTIMRPAEATVEITADEPLTVAVRDAVKDHPGVNATVNDGVIILTGEIKQSDRTILMQKLNALKPRKIDPSGLKSN